MHRPSRAAVLALALAAAACVQPPPPPPAPPPLAAAPDSAAAQRAARAGAQRAFDEGVALGRQSRWREAEERYRTAVRGAPDEARYRFALSTALVGQARVWEAADAFRDAIELEERAPRPNHRLLAQEYERLIQLLVQVNRTEDADAARARQAYHRQMRDAAVPD
jgi:tetratricopeptide (TPR) repeat protein